MRQENRRQKLPQYKAESWRDDEEAEIRGQKSEVRNRRGYLSDEGPAGEPTAEIARAPCDRRGQPQDHGDRRR